MRKVIIATVVIFVFTVCQMLCASSILPVTPTPTITLTLYEKENPDGKITIQLNSPRLTATQPRNIMAEDDDYTIEGTATGVDNVDIVLIGPDGYSRPAAIPWLDVRHGLEVTSSSVSDDDFSEKIEMSGAGFDTGMWTILVLSPGRDGDYGDLPPVAGGAAGQLDNLIDNIDGTVNNYLEFRGKDQGQVKAMFLDHTVDVAGSDDLLVSFTFKVEAAHVDLDSVALVAVGDPLVITGTTNREPEAMITISTFAGPTDLPAVMAEVEWPTKDEGVFNATIDTTDAILGTYTIEADDGDGHTDTVTVEIGTAAAATPTPTTPPQESIDEILKKLPMGKVLFNPPKEMKVGETELVEVRITQNITENLTKGLEGHGEPQIKETKVSPYMKVRLTGRNFDIDPKNGAEQIIERDKYTHWEFHVTPLKSGLQTLKLTYYVIIPFQGADRQKEYEVGDWKVSVNVTPMGLLKCYWQFIVGTLIAIVALIISIIGIIGIRKKRREKR